MSSRNRGRGDPLGSTDALLHAADTFAARPAEEVMDELGLTREKAQQWQRICAELAQAVRADLASTNSRPRAIRQRRDSNSNNLGGNSGPAGAERLNDVGATQPARH
jgi:hypothetical protein